MRCFRVSLRALYDAATNVERNTQWAQHHTYAMIPSKRKDVDIGLHALQVKDINNPRPEAERSFINGQLCPAVLQSP